MLVGHDADICVIGAGVAGALVAHACASRGASVVVLEAGPRLDRSQRPDQERRFLLGLDAWPSDPQRDAYVNSSDFAYPLHHSRLRAVGGSTLHWSGVAQRLFESDFQAGTRFGLGQDWPISYDDLEPYYARAERELGVAGEAGTAGPRRSTGFPMAPFPDSYGDGLWRRTAGKLGISVQPASYAKNNLVSYDGRPPCAAFATCEICPIGAQYSADWHILKAERTGRCSVVTDTAARRLETDAAGGIRVVHASGRDGSEHEVRARIYVVAAHAVESARLLLLSRIGNPAHLGRYLMEHWEASGAGLSDEPAYPMRVGFPTLHSFHYYDGPDRGERGAVRLVFRDGVDPYRAFGTRPGLWGREMARYDCETFGRWRAIEIGTEHQPNPASRVTLDPSVTDIFGDPAPNIRFELSDVDRRTLAWGRERIRELMDAAGLRDIRIGDRFTGGAHQMGTCRMSARAEDGVVDPNARVHDITNLYVAGSSLFPTAGGVTPTLTIAALSLRLADHLMALLGRST